MVPAPPPVISTVAIPSVMVTPSTPEPLKLREISEFLGVSKERVRQMKEVALKKLRKSANSQETRNPYYAIHTAIQAADVTAVCFCRKSANLSKCVKKIKIAASPLEVHHTAHKTGV